MFTLQKIEYGRTNIPEPCLMPAANAQQVTVGMALTMDASTHLLKKATGDCTAEYIALEDKATASAGEKILCYRVLPQMIFEVPLAAYSASAHVVGARIQLHTDGLRLGSAAASGIAATTSLSGSVYTTTVTQKLGAVIVDTLGAAAAGDKVLVRLA